ncbi:MAG TPA: hypothetical protein VF411_00945 [Bacteroidia bacterium]
MEDVKQYLKKLPKQKLIKTYSILLEVLKEKGIIRTNNLVGDLGEVLAIDFYNSVIRKQKLIQAKTNTKAYDAKTRSKITYAIKSTSGNRTGIFYGLEQEGSKVEDKKIFDYVIIVKFDKSYQVENIYEIDWKTFIEVKRWDKIKKAWYLSLGKDLIKKYNPLTPKTK